MVPPPPLRQLPDRAHRTARERQPDAHPEPDGYPLPLGLRFRLRIRIRIRVGVSLRLRVGEPDAHSELDAAALAGVRPQPGAHLAVRSARPDPEAWPSWARHLCAGDARPTRKPALRRLAPCAQEPS